MKKILRQKYALWKTRSPLRHLKNISENFPIPGHRIQNVLVVLPRQLTFLDSAINLVRDLRQNFSGWNFMMLDMDKVLKHKLNRLDLPNAEFISELELEKFDLVVDLNSEFDIRIGYLITMLKIPYRIFLFSDSLPYYNITINGNFLASSNYQGLIENLKLIFVESSN